MARTAIDPVWREVEKQVKQGKVPVIKLTSAARILEPKRPRGRPKGPASAWPLHTPSGNPIRCRAAGCTQRLKKGSTIVCSTACGDDLRSECSLMLKILNGELEPHKLPLYLRSNKLRRKRTM